MVRLGHVSASFWSYGRGIRTLFHFISFHYGLIKVRNTQIYLIWILLLKNVHFRGFCHILGLQLSRIHNFNVKCTIHIINLVPKELSYWVEKDESPKNHFYDVLYWEISKTTSGLLFCSNFGYILTDNFSCGGQIDLIFVPNDR